MVPKATPSLLLENFRCFVAPREIPLAPLTFLVGGNSSGKTSFLAAVRLAWDVSIGRDPNFNEDPFNLGSYDDIASFSAKEDGTAEHFSLGLRIPLTRQQRQRQYQPMTIRSTFSMSPENHPIVNNQTILSQDISIAIRHGQTEEGITINATFRSGATFVTTLKGESFSREIFSGTDGILRFIEMESYPHPRHKNEDILSAADRREIRSLSRGIRTTLGSHPSAHAPIRTRPKRTYDPLTPAPSPEGEHIPMLLLSFLQKKGDSQQKLMRFGRQSGLFSDLKVRRFGTPGDPFQVQAETRGHLHNIIDVGYGVSQALPIVVDVMNADRDAVLLIQQPEVHLHPKAQAEMGTFFAEKMKQRSTPIIVETHSDYMIDRVRLLIRKGQVRKEDVQVLFFAPRKTDVDIIPIGLDDDGSIIDPPEDYRKFFLDEQFEFFS